MNKLKLLKEICAWYNYELEIAGDEVHCFIDKNSKEYNFKYDNITVALKQWLPTLKESNSDAGTWSKEEIDFIESL